MKSFRVSEYVTAISHPATLQWSRAELETTANRNGQMNKEAVKKGTQKGLLKIKSFSPYFKTFLK